MGQGARSGRGLFLESLVVATGGHLVGDPSPADVPGINHRVPHRDNHGKNK